MAAYYANFQHVPSTVQLGFGSWQISSLMLIQMADAINAFSAIVVTMTILACGVSFVRDYRELGSVQPRTLVKYLTATVLAIMLTNKVLSPQYLVWLLPFAALLPARQSLLLILIMVITTLIYPLYFSELLHLARPEVVALNVRNFLLVVAFIWIVLPERKPTVSLPTLAAARAR